MYLVRLMKSSASEPGLRQSSDKQQLVTTPYRMQSLNLCSYEEKLWIHLKYALKLYIYRPVQNDIPERVLGENSDENFGCQHFIVFMLFANGQINGLNNQSPSQRPQPNLSDNQLKPFKTSIVLDGMKVN